MPTDWDDNDEGAGGTKVRQGMINIEAKLVALRSMFSATAFPTDAAREVGQPCWRTSGGPLGVGLYILLTKDADPNNDVWIFVAGDAGLTAFGESMNAAADATAARTLLALGTGAQLVSGTASGQIRTNSQNEGTFLQLANDLSDLASASTARTNLGLGALALLATVGTSTISDTAVTRAKLASIERSLVQQSKTTTYTAAAMEHVTCTVGTSWTLTLPTSPAAGERVSVYAKSITAGQVLTIEGTTKNILGGITTQLKLYVTGDGAELLYDGTEWIPQGGVRLAQHAAQLSASGWTRASGSTFLTVPFDTVDFDNAGIADHSSDRITIKRAGVYRVEGQLLASQTGPSHWHLEIRKNGSRLIELRVNDVFDYDAATERGGGMIAGYFVLAASDYLEFFQTEQVAASPASYARLTAIEQK